MTIEAEGSSTTDTTSTPPAQGRAESWPERRARHAAAIDGKTARSPATPPPTDTPAAASTPAEGGAPAPDGAPASEADKRKARIAETLARQQQAAADKRGRETAAQEQQRISQENAQLKAQLEQLRGQPNLDQFFADYDRDPAATLRKFKRDPEAALKLLTKDALAPGVVRGSAETAEIRAEVQQLKEQLAAKERAEQEQRQREAQVAAYEAENKAWADHVTKNKDRWPLAAALDPEDLVEDAIGVWQGLKAQGASYDRDLVADALEERLSRRHAKWQPPKAQPSSSTTDTPARPQAAAPKKAPAKTLTPELRSESSAPKPQSWAELKQAHIDRINRGE